MHGPMNVKLTILCLYLRRAVLCEVRIGLVPVGLTCVEFSTSGSRIRAKKQTDRASEEA